MTTLAVNAHFGKISKYGKGIFYLLDEESKEKIMRHVVGDHSPIKGDRLTLKIPKSISVADVGLRYRVTIKSKFYRFKSTRPENKGDELTGTSFELIDFVKI